jgi:hypothetical protein
MATWKVQQKIEMWKETTIEADTYQEAIDKSWDKSTEWEVLVDPTLGWIYEDQDEFWVQNKETGEALTVSPDGVHKWD